MDSVKLRVNLNEDDWQAYLLGAGQRAAGEAQSLSSRLIHWLPAGFVLLLAASTVAAYATGRFGRIALAALLSAMALLWLLRLVMRHSSRPTPEGLYLGPCEIEADATGLRVRKTNYESHFRWTSASGVTLTDTHVFIWLDRMSGQTIPIRDLPADVTPEVLTRAISSFVENSGAAAPAAASTETLPEERGLVGEAGNSIAAAPVPPGAPAHPLPNPLTELAQISKLLFLGKVRADLLHGRDITIAMCAIGAVAVHILLERVAIEGDAQFFPYNLPTFGFLFCIGLALAWLMARIAHPPVTFRRSLVLTSGFALFAAAALGIGGLWGRPGLFAAAAIVFFEFISYFGRAMRVIAGAPKYAALTAGFLLLGSLGYLNSQYYLDLSVWYSPDPETEFDPEFRDSTSLKRERLAFEQALMIDRHLAAIQRAPTDDSQFFFVGFAGYGRERVFSEEIQFAAQRIDERFDVKGRSLLLINDQRDLERYPWASASALRVALRGMSKAMDVERDILVLALSSHGGKNGSLTVSDGRPFTPDLPPEELADILRESGIRWKVVIVSACHAGAFIEPLRDDYTMVLTASAADRTSFGCSDDRDLTYFGEAFYRDALPTAPSLREAFEAARKSIERREDAEGISASQPQAHFGSEIEKKLAGMP